MKLRKTFIEAAYKLMQNGMFDMTIANEKVELFSEIKDFFEEYVNYPELNLPNGIELKDEYTLENN